MSSSIYRCRFGHAFQLANCTGWHENAHRHRDGHLSQGIGCTQHQRFESRRTESHVHRHQSHCAVVHWFSFVLEYTVPVVHGTLFAIHSDWHSICSGRLLCRRSHTDQSLDCEKHPIVFREFDVGKRCAYLTDHRGAGRCQTNQIAHLGKGVHR